MRGQQPGNKGVDLPGLKGLSLRGTAAAYGAWMLHLLTRAGSPARARLALGMGPQAHWTGALTGNLVMVVPALGIVIATQLFPQWQTGHSMRSGLLLGVAFPVVFLLDQWPSALWSSRREQALLRLLPQSPQGPALNRWLALHVAGLVVATCAFQASVVALLAALPGPPPVWPHAADIALAATVLSPLSLPLLWRNWSAQRQPTGARTVQMFMALAVVLGSALVWVTLLGWPWWAAGGLTLAVLPPLTLWRWHALGRLPAAWPTGRLST